MKDEQSEQDDVGSCCIRAPVYCSDVGTTFPAPWANEWCGEHKPREAPPAPVRLVDEWFPGVFGQLSGGIVNCAQVAPPAALVPATDVDWCRFWAEFGRSSGGVLSSTRQAERVTGLMLVRATTAKAERIT